MGRPLQCLSVSSSLSSLFDAYAGDLARFAPALEGKFGCPICLRAVARTPHLSDVVAKEHIVPSALGGRLVTLTCRQCNNRSGSQLESHLVRRVRVDSGKSPSSVRLTVGGVVQRGEILLEPEGDPQIRINVIGRQSDPRLAAEMERLVADGKDEMHLQVNSGYVPLRSLVALVRSAYLLMFRTFGYRYVLDSSAVAIREQILKPTAETDVLTGASWRVDAGAPPSTSLALAKAPDDRSGFVAFLALDADSGHVAAVTLPPPGVDGEEFYRTLAESQARRTYHLSVLPEPDGFVPLAELWQLANKNGLV